MESGSASWRCCSTSGKRGFELSAKERGARIRRCHSYAGNALPVSAAAPERGELTAFRRSPELDSRSPVCGPEVGGARRKRRPVGVFGLLSRRSPEPLVAAKKKSIREVLFL